MQTKKSQSTFATEAQVIISNLLDTSTRMARLIEETPMKPAQRENLTGVVGSLTTQVEAIQLALAEEDIEEAHKVELIQNAKDSLLQTEEFLLSMEA